MIYDDIRIVGAFPFEDLGCARLTARAIKTPQVVFSLPRPGDLTRTATGKLENQNICVCIFPSSVEDADKIVYEMNTTSGEETACFAGVIPPESKIVTLCSPWILHHGSPIRRECWHCHPLTHFIPWHQSLKPLISGNLRTGFDAPSG